MSFIIFIIVLSILVIVHEYGHFATAKALGVRVEKFSIGFGPKLFSFPWQNTEFMVCLIPLGGYVKMSGDERDKCVGESQEFYSHPIGHRALIVLMGPVVNYVLAFVCFWVVFMIGYPSISPMVGEIIKDYPAQSAGLEAGDIILKIDQQSIKSWEEVQRHIKTSKTEELKFTVKRQQTQLFLTIRPRIEKLENIFGQQENVRLVGIKPKEEMVLLQYGFLESLTKSADRLWEITATTYEALYRLATGTKAAKDLVTGPIGIFFVIQKAATMGFSYVLYIMAVISASLAIFNLLPLPVLDGGHLFFMLIEKFRGRPLSIKAEEFVTKLGFSLIICLAVFVFYSDLSRFGLLDRMMGLWQNLTPNR